MVEVRRWQGLRRLLPRSSGETHLEGWLAGAGAPRGFGRAVRFVGRDLEKALFGEREFVCKENVKAKEKWLVLNGFVVIEFV